MEELYLRMLVSIAIYNVVVHVFPHADFDTLDRVEDEKLIVEISTLFNA